jgi:ketosteroid isomerase-like protein
VSRETVELVRRAYGAFNRGDLEAMVLVAAPEFEYVATGAIPGAGGVYRGAEEFVQFLDRWWGEFDEPRVEVHELIEARDQVLASVTFRGHGKQSGVEANWNLWQLWTVRDGKFVRGRGFTSRQEALDAAAVRE